MLQRWRQSQGGLRDWVKVLPDLVYNYNHTIHATIHQRPIDVFSGAARPQQIPILTSALKFKVGDYVRLRNLRKVFDKGDALRYSKDVYVIISVQGARFKVRNTLTGAEPHRRYKEVELLAVPSPPKEHPSAPRKTARQRKAEKELNTTLPRASTGPPGSERDATTRRIRKPNQFNRDFIQFADD